jgi:hypothetical protein
VVRHDLVLLEEGDRIPADGIAWRCVGPEDRICGGGGPVGETAGITS